MSGIDRIVVATDFSPNADKALKVAEGLARERGAELHVLHVYPLLAHAVASDILPDDPAFEERLKQELSELLAGCVASLPGDLTIESALVQGTPAREIPAYAKKVGADLIVIGTHGRTGFQHMMLGSVAERTLRLSPVPVLTVPSDRD